jgi:hypothetical protein
MTLDYYAYWNGAQIRDLFEALVAITSGPDYAGLLKAVALAGFLAALCTALFRWQAAGVRAFFAALCLFYSALLIPKASVAIHDERAASVYVVGNVPLGIAFLASATSHAGYWLTESFERAFTTEDAMRFSRFGMAFPQRAVTTLQNAAVVTPKGKAALQGLVAHCIAPELLDYPEKAAKLAESPNLWQEIKADGWLNPARTLLTEEGEVLRCDEAALRFENLLQTEELPQIKKLLAGILMPERNDPQAALLSALPYSEALLLGLSRSMDESLTHSVMLQAVPEGLASFAQIAGSPMATLEAFAKSNARLASEINYRSMSELAKETLPKLRNAFEFIIIAAFPLVLVMILASGAASLMVLKNYLTLLIWVQLWAPLASVVNYLLISHDAHPLTRLAAEYGGNTLMVADLIREMGASSQALAGQLMLLVPIIALALAKGGEFAAASMVNAALAPAQSAAGASASAAASGNIAAGNVSLGSVSVNSVQGNSRSLAAKYEDPDRIDTRTAYGAVQRDSYGAVTSMTRSPIDLGVSASAGFSQTASAAQSARTEQSAAAQTSEVFTETFGGTKTASKGASYTAAAGSEITQGESVRDAAGGSENAAELTSALSTDAASRALATSEGASYASGAGVGSPRGGGADGGKAAAGLKSGLAGIAGALSQQTGLKLEAAQKLVDTAVSTDVSVAASAKSAAFQKLTEAVQTVAANNTESAVRSDAESFQRSLQEAHSRALTAGSTRTDSAAESRSAQSADTGSVATSVNHDALVMQRLTRAGMSPEAALQRLFESRSAKEGLAADVAAALSESAKNAEHVGPAQIRSDVPGAARSRLAGGPDASEIRSRTEDRTAPVGEALSELPVPGSVSLDIRETRAAALEAERSRLAAKAAGGNQAVRGAVERYQKEEKGVGTVLSVALAGGSGYRSPQEAIRSEPKEEKMKQPD